MQRNPARRVPITVDHHGTQPTRRRAATAAFWIRACAMVLGLLAAGPALAADIFLDVTRPVGVNVAAWHFRTGVPLPKDHLTNPANIKLFRGSTEIPVRGEVLATWGPSNNSIKWLGVDFTDAVTSGATPQYKLVTNVTGGIAPSPAVSVTDGATQITINNGRLNLVINKTKFNLFDTVSIDGNARWASPGSNKRGAYIVQNDNGTPRTYWAESDTTPSIVIEQQNASAAVIRAEGWYVDTIQSATSVSGEPTIDYVSGGTLRDPRPTNGKAFGRWITRIYIGANEPTCRVQHTFVITEDHKAASMRIADIGFHVPADNTTTLFGGHGSAVSGHHYLLQHSDDAFKLVRVSDGANVTTGAKAEGWVKVGSTLGVAIKDFWQNYPKEFESNPAAGWLKVHLWPDHGIAREDTDAAITPANGWRMRFLHTGDDLNFNIPTDYTDISEFGNERGYWYTGMPTEGPQSLGKGQSVDQGVNSNAFGVAKTHTLLFGFSNDFDSHRVAFQTAPHVLAEPSHMETTDAVERLTAADPVKYPTFEANIREGLKFYWRAIDHERMYGMWNYGDTHDQWKWHSSGTLYGPQYYRLRNGQHHDKPRFIWWAYLRNGDPDHLDFARANTQYCADVVLCHWENATFAGQSGDTSRKKYGGLTHYKGFVPWKAGSLADYNSVLDQYALDFYLTGNRRSWDALKLHGDYLKFDPINQVDSQEDSGRAAAGQLAGLLAWYEAKWHLGADTTLQNTIHTHVQLIRNGLPKDHSNNLNWVPWIDRYLRLCQELGAATQYNATLDYLEDWITSGFAGEKGANQSGATRQAFFGDEASLVAARFFHNGASSTPDAKYCAERIFFRGSEGYLNSSGYVLNGLDFNGWNGEAWREWVFNMRDGMLAMKAAKTTTLSLADLDVAPSNTNRTHFLIRGPRRNTGTAQEMKTVIYHDGTAMSIKVGTQDQNANTTSVLRKPGGSIIVSKTTTGDTSGFDTANITTNQTTYPIGFYDLTHSTTAQFDPIQPLHLPKTWTQFGYPNLDVSLMRARAFFYVPSDASSISLTFRPGTFPNAAGLFYMPFATIYKHDLTEVQRVPIGRAYGNLDQTVTANITVAPADRGKVWFVQGVDFAILDSQNGLNHQVVAASPNAFLAPGPTFPGDTGGGTAPEITVSGNGVNIADGDLSPSTSDHTDFGSVAQGGTAVTRTFTVQNTGTADLHLGTPTLPSGFTAGSNPLVSTLAPSASDTFTIVMPTTTPNGNMGSVVIDTDDPNEDPFDFAIMGTVTGPSAPEINVSGNGVNIADGDLSPSTSDHTDFGSATQGGAAITRTFTVTNNGSAALTTSGMSVPSGYSITESLSSSIAASGGSDTFTISLSTANTGTFNGNISFTTNDGDENPFNFAITGVINPSGGGTEIYVSTSGNDTTGNGTIGSPYRTIAKGISLATAGQSVVVRTGTYTETLTSFPNSGTSFGNAITIKNYPGETVTVRPSSGTYVIHVSTTRSYIVFDGLIIDGDVVTSDAVRLSGGANRIRFTNCDVKNGTVNGIYVTGAGFNEFINTKSHHNTNHGIYIQGDNNLVDGCEIYTNPGRRGVLIEADTADNNVIRKSKFYGNDQAIDLRDGDNNLVYNNICYSNTIGVRDYNSTSGNEIYNNTCHGNSSKGIDIGAGAATAVVKNNIVYGNTTTDLAVAGSNGSFTHNFYGTITQAGSGNTYSSNLTGNPLFVDAANRDYHLQSSSTAKNAGTTLTDVPDDYAGTSRPQGGAYDMGAYEQ